jgi:hypothetical protein
MTETFINKSTLQENYSTLPNKLINDEKLSGDGLAVLVYLLSKPADWKVNAQNIANRFGWGIKKVYNIMKHLIQIGYMAKDTKREQGKFATTLYFVYDSPLSHLPQVVLPQVAERQVVFGNTYKVKKEQSKESTNEREPTIWDIAVPRLIQSGIDEKKARGVIMMLLKSLKLVKDVTEKEKIVLDAIFKMPDTVTQYDRVLPYLTAIVKKADKVIEPVKVYGSVIKQLTADDVLTAGPAMQDYYRRKKEMEVINLVNSGAVNKEQIGWFYGS